MNLVPQFLINIVTGVLCLFLLVGFGAGIFAIVKKKKLFGILSAAGFFLLGNFWLFSIIVPKIVESIFQSGRGTAAVYSFYSWSMACLPSLFFFLASVAFTAAIIIVVGIKAKKEMEDLTEVQPDVEVLPKI